MMDLSNKVLGINNKEYIVMETVSHENRVFVLITNKENKNDSKYVEVVERDGHMETLPISPDLFREEILPLFINKFESYNATES